MNADKFHAHLDVCARCRTKPFDLCPVGGQLLRAAALDPEPPEQPRPISEDR